MCCDTVNRGLAYGDGKIFLQQADTTLVALDAKTGKVVWTRQERQPEDRRDQHQRAARLQGQGASPASPAASSACAAASIAYDIKTGKQVWTAYSTGPDNEMLIDPAKTMTWTNGKMAPVGKDSSLKTWQGDQWKLGGGTTWGWYSYDPKLNLVYYGTGNPGTWNPAQRPGDNKWSMTIFARDLDTGMAKWVYQMTPHDEWDYRRRQRDAADRRRRSTARRSRRWCTSTATASATRSTVQTGELLVGAEVRPGGELGDQGRHEDRPSGRRQEVLARHDRSRRRT